MNGRPSFSGRPSTRSPSRPVVRSARTATRHRTMALECRSHGLRNRWPLAHMITDVARPQVNAAHAAHAPSIQGDPRPPLCHRPRVR